MYSHLVLCLLRCALSSEIDSGSMHSTRMRDSPSYLREHSEAASKMGAVTFVILARLASVIAAIAVAEQHLRGGPSAHQHRRPNRPWRKLGLAKVGAVRSDRASLISDQRRCARRASATSLG